MKRQISLKWFFALAILSLGMVLVVGYSILSAQFFIRGMDNIVSANMETATKHFVDTVPTARHREINDFEGYQISSRWEQLPEPIRDAFGAPPTRTGVLLKHDASGPLQAPDVIHFLMRFHIEGEDLYISHTVSRATALQSVGHNVIRNMQLLWVISAVSALMIALIIWLLIRRVSRPVAELGAWARSLDSSNSGKTVPDFGYPELNRLAELIRASVSSVQESVEREQRFLRHASHELRTPISVIRSNVELIHKLNDDHKSQLDNAETLAFQRIDRASLNMQHMTETLLWLSRDELDALPTQRVDVGSLLEHLVDEKRYLLAEKHVNVNVLTDSHMCDLPITASTIVLGNLIRNAFQHTWDGEVSIVQSGLTIHIENRSEDAGINIDNEATGFGLGLQLTEQLTDRLHWEYRNLPITGGRLVELKLAG